MKKSNFNLFKFFLLTLFSLFFIASFTFAQSSDDWVRVRNGNIPEDAIRGGYETDGRKTYVCRAKYRGKYFGGKALDDRCYYNPGSREVSASRFEVLTGKYNWSSSRSYSKAIIVGGSNYENFYACRVKDSNGLFSGRTEDGRCYYTKNNRGYSDRRFEVLQGRYYTKTLIEAASRGDYEDVRDALDDGQAIDQKDSSGKTALMIASEKGHSRIVREILYQRPTIDIGDDKGNTALLYAASNGRSEIVESLLLEGANINARNKDGDTAFTLAASGGYERLVDSFLRDENLGGVASSDIEKGFRNAAYNGHTNVLQTLIEYGVNVESRDFNGKTALMFAASGGKAKAVRLLLQNDANINAMDDSRSWTPFLYAVNSNSESVLQIFFDEKQYIKANDKDAERGLHIAAENDKRKSLRYLLTKGVNVNSKSIDRGWTALMFAARMGQEKSVKLLIKANSDLNLQNNLGKTALMLAAAKSKNNTTKVLVKAGADLNLRDNNGMTALGLAIQNKHKDTRKTLKKAKAKQ